MTGLMAVTLAITAFVVGVAYGVAGATELNDLQPRVADIATQPVHGVALEVERRVVRRIKERHADPCLPTLPQHPGDFPHDDSRLRNVLKHFKANHGVETATREREALCIGEQIWPSLIEIPAGRRVIQRDVLHGGANRRLDPPVGGTDIE